MEIIQTLKPIKSHKVVAICKQIMPNGRMIKLESKPFVYPDRLMTRTEVLNQFHHTGFIQNETKIRLTTQFLFLAENDMVIGCNEPDFDAEHLNSFEV